MYRYTSIAARLYQIPEWREKYHARVLELLDRVWDEQALAAEVDRIRDLTGTPEALLEQVRRFISQHEARVRVDRSDYGERRDGHRRSDANATCRSHEEIRTYREELPKFR